jgi:HEPN domain-containing protein
MVEPRLELVRAWLAKALHDLGTAGKAAADPDPFLDTAVYHCQQAAEKSLKAFLTFHDVLFDKTHNLGSLLVQVAGVDSSFMGLADAAETLTPYATLYRYPSDLLEPSRGHPLVRCLEIAARSEAGIGG